MMVEVGMMTCRRYRRRRSCYCRVGGGVRDQHVPLPRHHSEASVADDHHYPLSSVVTRERALSHAETRDDEVEADVDAAEAKTGC